MVCLTNVFIFPPADSFYDNANMVIDRTASEQTQLIRCGFIEGLSGKKRRKHATNSFCFSPFTQQTVKRMILNIHATYFTSFFLNYQTCFFPLNIELLSQLLNTLKQIMQIYFIDHLIGLYVAKNISAKTY